MRDGIVRLGLIYPEGGGEYEYYQFAESVGYRVRPYIICARSYGDDHGHDPEELKQTARIDLLEGSAHSLLPLEPDSTMWACTSASFILGRAYAERQAAAVKAVVGCPTSSTSLAFVAAIQALGIGRVALLGSYPEPATRAFESFLREFDIEVVGVKWLEAPGGRTAFEIPHADLRVAARELDSAETGAILIPDTAMAALAVVEDLEAELGKPILTANQVTLWQGLRLANYTEPTEGWGRLLKEA